MFQWGECLKAHDFLKDQRLELLLSRFFIVKLTLLKTNMEPPKIGGLGCYFSFSFRVLFHVPAMKVFRGVSHFNSLHWDLFEKLHLSYKVGPLLLNGVIGPVQMAENKWVTGVQVTPEISGVRSPRTCIWFLGPPAHHQPSDLKNILGSRLGESTSVQSLESRWVFEGDDIPGSSKYVEVLPVCVLFLEWKHKNPC